MLPTAEVVAAAIMGDLEVGVDLVPRLGRFNCYSSQREHQYLRRLVTRVVEVCHC